MSVIILLFNLQQPDGRNYNFERGAVAKYAGLLQQSKGEGGNKTVPKLEESRRSTQIWTSKHASNYA